MPAILDTLDWTSFGHNLVLVPQTMIGYIDGGTGSYLVQMLLAGILGGAFMMKSFVLNLKGAIRRPKSVTATNSVTEDGSRDR